MKKHTESNKGFSSLGGGGASGCLKDGIKLGIRPMVLFISNQKSVAEILRVQLSINHIKDAKNTVFVFQVKIIVNLENVSPKEYLLLQLC